MKVPQMKSDSHFDFHSSLIDGDYHCILIQPWISHQLLRHG
jgi:hypothetical protein